LSARRKEENLDGSQQTVKKLIQDVLIYLANTTFPKNFWGHVDIL
jgi:hypothetical protein